MPRSEPAPVVRLQRWLPQRVRLAAVRAYRAHKAMVAARAELAAAMRELRDACREHSVDPAHLLVGDTVGTALVPADGGGDGE